MPSAHRILQLRMAGTVLALVSTTAGFLAGIWLVFYGLFAMFGGSAPGLVATLVTAGVLVGIGTLEYRQLETIERRADAYPVDEETAPEVYQITTRVAAQFGVPVPTIAISDRRTPEALAVGFRPGNVHLVLSLGTIDALSAAQLEAVIAHELAHVKNRDAMVMTILSMPVVLAGGLRSRIEGPAVDDPNRGLFFLLPLMLVANVFWVLGRTITARLSRAREVAADRAAAELTGSPATLASALETLDREIEARPTRDLREASGISALSILPLEPRDLEDVLLGPEGDIEPSYGWLYRIERWLFDTHPPTSNRLEALSALEADRE